MPQAGDDITAALLTWDQGGTTLSNDSASAINTWEQYGSETIQFSNPGVAVKITAHLCGRILNTTDTNTNGTARCAISFDGGSTFTSGNEPFVSSGTDSGGRGGYASAHYRAGTPSGDIIVKAELRTSDTTNAFNDGFLTAILTPQ